MIDSPAFAPLAPIQSGLILHCRAVADEMLRGRWEFKVQTGDGETILSADDSEIGDLNRLALWSAVRGLESLDGHQTVTLVSTNRYLVRSMTDSLPRWRAGDFCWEHFGRVVEVQNADLWRRVDRALSIHQVSACWIQTRLVSPPVRRIDTPSGVPAPKSQRRRSVTSDLNTGRQPSRRFTAAELAAH